MCILIVLYVSYCTINYAVLYCIAFYYYYYFIIIIIIIIIITRLLSHCNEISGGNKVIKKTKLHLIITRSLSHNNKITGYHILGWMDERCLRPLFSTIKAELGREQPGSYSRVGPIGSHNHMRDTYIM